MKPTRLDALADLAILKNKPAVKKLHRSNASRAKFIFSEYQKGVIQGAIQLYLNELKAEENPYVEYIDKVKSLRDHFLLEAEKVDIGYAVSLDTNDFTICGKAVKIHGSHIGLIEFFHKGKPLDFSSQQEQKENPSPE